MRIFGKNKPKKRKAFSFIEVVISIFIISVGLVSSIALISVSLRDSIDSRKQMIASLLAQEGAELVRNIRDNNWIDNNPATTSFNGISASTTALRYTDGVGYGSSGSDATPFSRKINITVVSANEITVTSAVIWGSDFPGTISETSCNTSNKCAFVKTRLNNWGE